MCVCVCNVAKPDHVFFFDVVLQFGDTRLVCICVLCAYVCAIQYGSDDNGICGIACCYDIREAHGMIGSCTHCNNTIWSNVPKHLAQFWCNSEGGSVISH